MGIREAIFFTHSISGVSLGKLYEIELSRRIKNLQSTDEPSDDRCKLGLQISFISIYIRPSWVMSVKVDLDIAGFDERLLLI